MNNKTHVLRIFFVAVIIVCSLGSLSYGQEPAPELEFDEYRIVGRDTRVFEITGDRVSTIEFTAFPMPLPEEERGIETSEGLIGNDERLWYSDRFGTVIGPYMRAELFAGSNTIADLWGKASLDMGQTAGTMEIIGRMAEENTPTNTAPSVRGLQATGYYGGLGTRYSAGFGFSGESDELRGDTFRHRNREASRYNAGFSMRTGVGSWDAAGSAVIDGGSYDDKELPYDDNEFNIGGKLKLTGDVSDMTVVSDTATEFMQYSGEDGYIISTGLRGFMLLWDSFSLRAGGNLYISSMGDDTDTRIRPEAGFDWALTRSAYLRASYKPEVVAYSHSDLYNLNGLMMPVPLLTEFRKTAVDGEFGWRLKPELLFTAGLFYTAADDALVFTDAANGFFGIEAGAETTITGGRIRTQYDRDGKWGFDGTLTFRDAGLDGGGDVPYTPAFDALVRGYLKPGGKWTIHGALNAVGEHYTTVGTDDTEDGFFTVDCGIEREIMDMFSVLCEVRNITNSEGAWWTSRYQIPGIGLYGGLKAQF